MAAVAETRQPTYRQTFRRHRKLLSLPMVLGILVAGLFVVKHTTTYSSTASLWVDTPPSVASTVGATSSAAATSPAAAEQALLSELLTTRAFAAAVANDSALRQYLGRDAAAAAALLEHGQVVVTVEGNQVMQVSYKGDSDGLTRSVLTGILNQLQQSSNGLLSHRDKAAVAYDKSQVQDMSTQLNAARNQIAQYEAQHPGANPKSDPTLSALTSAESSAATQYTIASGNLNQALANNVNGGAWSVSVVDPPSTPTPSVQGKKTMIETLFAGLFGGFLVSLLGAMVLTPTRVERWEDELPTAPHNPGVSSNGNGHGSLPLPIPPPAPGAVAHGDGNGRQETTPHLRLSPVRQLVLRRPGDDHSGS